MSGDFGEYSDPPRATDASPPATSWPDRPLRHTYNLTTDDASFRHAFSLMHCALPYAAARFAWLLAYSAGTIGWLAVTFCGGLWLSTNGSVLAGRLWCAAWLLAHLLVWQRFLRAWLYLIACGHVAILTEIITGGRVGNAELSMLQYGRRMILQRFRSAGILSDLQSSVRGAIHSFHATLSWANDVRPHHWPRGRGVPRLLLQRSAKYLDMAILSYDLARKDADPWRATRDGVMYYCQNAKPMLRTAVGIVLLDLALTALIWVFLFAAGTLLATPLRQPFGEAATLAVFAVAGLLAANVRAAFLKPVLLVMVMVRFHNLAEGQVINAAWEDRLNQISEQFRTMWNLRHTSWR